MESKVREGAKQREEGGDQESNLEEGVPNTRLSLNLTLSRVAPHAFREIFQPCDVAICSKQHRFGSLSISGRAPKALGSFLSDEGGFYYVNGGLWALSQGGSLWNQPLMRGLELSVPP